MKFMAFLGRIIRTIGGANFRPQTPPPTTAIKHFPSPTSVPTTKTVTESAKTVEPVVKGPKPQKPLLSFSWGREGLCAFPKKSKGNQLRIVMHETNSGGYLYSRVVETRGDIVVVRRGSQTFKRLLVPHPY
ncbi:MAG TPA: hypothetical protein VJH94_01160 [Candidatus Paceibacterota bacterium]